MSDTQHNNPSVSQDRGDRPSSGYFPVDDFPTPPWGTRALMEDVILPRVPSFDMSSVWEPACNRGYMAAALREYFREVTATDMYNYGYGQGHADFTDPEAWRPLVRPAWVITNPPFSRFKEFALRALGQARQGVALLGPLQAAATEGRYEDLFTPHPPSLFCPFVERLPMHQGRYEPDGSTSASYAWYVWVRGWAGPEIVHRIPPGRKRQHYQEDDLRLPDRDKAAGLVKRYPRAVNVP